MTNLQSAIKAKALDLCAEPEGRYLLPKGHPVIARVEEAIRRYHKAGVGTWEAIKHYHHITGKPLFEGMIHRRLDMPMALSLFHEKWLNDNPNEISALERKALDCVFDAERAQLPLTEGYRNTPEQHLITEEEARTLRHKIEKTPEAYAPLISRLEKRTIGAMKDGEIIVDDAAFHKALNEDLLGGAIKRAIDIAIEHDNFVFFIFHKPELKQRELDNLPPNPQNTPLLMQELASFLYERYADDFSHSFMGSQAMRSLKHIAQGKELSYHEERFMRQLSLQPVFTEKVTKDDIHHFNHLNFLLDAKTQLGTWLQKALKPEPKAAHLCRT